MHFLQYHRDTVFSEAEVSALIERKHKEVSTVWKLVLLKSIMHSCTMVLQGTLAALVKEEAPSWYGTEYKKRKGNPYAWVSQGDKFPLSSQLVC